MRNYSDPTARVWFINAEYSRPLNVFFYQAYIVQGAQYAASHIYS